MRLSPWSALQRKNGNAALQSFCSNAGGSLLDRFKRAICLVLSILRMMADKENTSNTAVETTETSTKAAKKPAKRKSKTEQKNASHPPTGEMVIAAIKELKDRKGSSLQAIKKYVTSNYKIDGEKVSPYIRKYLKSAVASGALVQTKGKGASGSFKLSTGKAPETSTSKKMSSPRRKSVPKKSQAVVKATPNKAKKVATEKKPAALRKGATKAVVKPKAAIEAKNMSKSKRTTKAPAAKTKTPKAKKVGASRTVKSSPKK